MWDTFNPSTGEAEAGGSLCMPDQPDLYIEFQASQGYIVRPSQKNEERKEKKRLFWGHSSVAKCLSFIFFLKICEFIIYRTISKSYLKGNLTCILLHWLHQLYTFDQNVLPSPHTFSLNIIYLTVWFQMSAIPLKKITFQKICDTNRKTRSYMITCFLNIRI